MKQFIFIYGPNGVGKSSVCRLLHQKLSNSALIEPEWCRQINPFTLTPEIQQLVENNLVYLMRSYFTCSLVNYVIFNYGFHGARRQIFDRLMKRLDDIDYTMTPIELTCSEEENIRRMVADGRENERIERAISSRHRYDALSGPTIDSTHMSVEEVVSKLLHLIATTTPIADEKLTATSS
ncbi:MAG: AAA family ATPase [Caldilineaceae bacterium]|nr:AAA family ATPase [Caldilineaceae bacterium]